MNLAQLRHLIATHYGIRTDHLDETALRALAPEQDHARRSTAGYPSQSRAGIQPTTVNPETRTVDIVIATDDPVEVIDWDRWEVVDEVLRMDGLRLDQIRKQKLPLLDTHQRNTARNVLGSVRDLAITEHEFTGTEEFSEVCKPEFTKTAEGHLDQRSVGYRVFAATYIEPGETSEVNGQTHTAGIRTLKVVTDWLAIESSVCPIGADPAAGTRSATTNPPPANQNQRNQCTMKITPELRAALIALGLPQEATDDEARDFLSLPETQTALLARQAPAPPPEPSEPDQSSASGTDSRTPSQVLADEGNRQAAIRAVYAPYETFPGVAAQRDTALQFNCGIDADAARANLLEHLRASTPALGRMSTGVEEADQVRQTLEDAIVLRALSSLNGYDPAASGITPERHLAANEVRNLSMLRICEESLVRCNHLSPAEVRALDPMTMVGAAFTHRLQGRAIDHSTGDFTDLLNASAHKILLAAYGMIPQTWREWCYILSVANFKAHEIHELGGFTVLEDVPEGAEFPHHTLRSEKASITAATKGNIFAITRHGIINDDLNALARIPMLQGFAAARSINRLAVTTLLSNLATIFTTARANLLHGTAYAPDTLDKCKLGLNALKKQQLLQTDIAGETIGIMPGVALCGPTAQDYMSEAIADVSTIAADRTPNRGIRSLRPVVEPDLENSTLTGYSTTAYFTFCNPAILPVIALAFLNGQDQPTLEQKDGWDVDGTEYKCRVDVGAGVAGYRGAQRATGIADPS